MKLRASSIATLTLTIFAASLRAQVDPADEGNRERVVVHEVQAPLDRGPEKSGGNDWFEYTRMNLGTFVQEEDAVGEFPFKNPRDVVVKMSNIQGSCTCTKAEIEIGKGETKRRYVYDSDKVVSRIVVKDGVETKERVAHINVGPGEEGVIRVHMAMGGVTGPKEASLSLQLSDKKLPMVNLEWSATGATFFNVNPPEVNLNEMSWSDEREFEFEITSPLRKDFNLLSHDELPQKMTIDYHKEMKDGRAVWKVHGKYGPGVNERDGGGEIRFKTDVDGKTVTARVIAFVKGPLEMKPGGFVSLGNVPAGKGKSKEITLTPNGDFDLQVTKLEVVRLNLKGELRKFFKVDSRKEGKSVKVRIAVLPGMPRTIVRGTIRIHLNHPSAPLKEVMFNGFVR